MSFMMNLRDLIWCISLTLRSECGRRVGETMRDARALPSRVLRHIVRGCGCGFSVDRLDGGALEEEIEIASHHQVRRKRKLRRRALAFHKELVQHAKCHASLRTRSLIDGCRYGA